MSITYGDVTYVTRAAEGAITFATGCEFAPVIVGSAATQVKAATDSATTVIGFARKPTTADSIADGDAVDIAVSGVVAAYVSGTVTVNDPLEVHSTVTQVAKLTLSAYTDITKRVARVVIGRTGAGLAWVEVRGGY